MLIRDNICLLYTSSLPHTLCRKGQDCRIVVPLYGTIPQELKNSMNFITNFTVPDVYKRQCPNKTTYCYVNNEKATKDKFYKGWMYTGDIGTRCV